MVTCANLDVITVTIVDSNGNRLDEFCPSPAENRTESDGCAVRYIQSTLNEEFAICVDLTKLMRRFIKAEGILY
jgi:hypothetical protein